MEEELLQKIRQSYQARLERVARLMAAGVEVMDPATVYIEGDVRVGPGTVILPCTMLRGRVEIGRDCTIGPNAVIQDCIIGNGVTVNASQLTQSTVGAGAKIGPFAYIRPNSHIGRDVKVGDFVEIKNSTLGDGTKVSHLTYVGGQRHRLRHGDGELRRRDQVPHHHPGPRLYRLQHQPGGAGNGGGGRLYRRRLHHYRRGAARFPGHRPQPPDQQEELGPEEAEKERINACIL